MTTPANFSPPCHRNCPGKVSNKLLLLHPKPVFSVLILWSLRNPEGALETPSSPVPSHSPCGVSAPLHAAAQSFGRCLSPCTCRWELVSGPRGCVFGIWPFTPLQPSPELPNLPPAQALRHQHWQTPYMANTKLIISSSNMPLPQSICLNCCPETQTSPWSPPLLRLTLQVHRALEILFPSCILNLSSSPSPLPNLLPYLSSPPHKHFSHTLA